MENSDLENELVKYQPDMIKYAVYLTNDYEYALDIVQDVNYQILKNRDKFESRQYSLKISFIFMVGSINSIFYFLHKAAEPFNCLEQDNLA